MISGVEGVVLSRLEWAAVSCFQSLRRISNRGSAIRSGAMEVVKARKAAQEAAPAGCFGFELLRSSITDIFYHRVN